MQKDFSNYNNRNQKPIRAVRISVSKPSDNELDNEDLSQSVISYMNELMENNKNDGDRDFYNQLKGMINDKEKKRFIYQNVVNAFINQQENDQETVFQKDEENDLNKKSLDLRFNQSQIIKNYKEEFEKLYQFSKLNVLNNPVLDVVEMNQFDKIKQYEPASFFQMLYKQLWYFKEQLFDNFFILINTIAIIFIRSVSWIALQIVTHPIFTFLTLVVIIFNSIILAINDPTTDADNNESIDLALLIIYTIEMVLKIFAYGFILNKNSYMRDGWNLIDLIIVISGYLPYIINSGNLNLSSLRSLRVLRPLRSISKIKSLNQLLNALFSAIPLLKDSLIILGFFYIIFGIAALQLFSGQLKNRCIAASTGILYGDDINNIYLCSSDGDCGSVGDPNVSYICSKGMISPNYDNMNFDTFGWSILNIFIIVSNEGWTNIMYSIQHAFSYYALFFFIGTIFVGSLFLMNLTMAIIGVKYFEAIEKQEPKTQIKLKKSYNYQNLLQWGIYKSSKQKLRERQQKRLKKIQQISGFQNHSKKNSQNSIVKIVPKNEISEEKKQKLIMKQQLANQNQQKKESLSDQEKICENVEEDKIDLKKVYFSNVSSKNGKVFEAENNQNEIDKYSTQQITFQNQIFKLPTEQDEKVLFTDPDLAILFSNNKSAKNQEQEKNIIQDEIDFNDFIKNSKDAQDVYKNGSNIDNNDDLTVKLENNIKNLFKQKLDLQEQEYRLLLDSKYLKTRVLLQQQPQSYEDDILPKRRQQIISKKEQMYEQQLKNLRLRIKYSSQISKPLLLRQKEKSQRTIPLTQSLTNQEFLLCLKNRNISTLENFNNRRDISKKIKRPISKLKHQQSNSDSEGNSFHHSNQFKEGELQKLDLFKTTSGQNTPIFTSQKMNSMIHNTRQGASSFIQQMEILKLKKQSSSFKKVTFLSKGHNKGDQISRNWTLQTVQQKIFENLNLDSNQNEINDQDKEISSSTSLNLEKAVKNNIMKIEAMQKNSNAQGILKVEEDDENDGDDVQEKRDSQNQLNDQDQDYEKLQKEKIENDYKKIRKNELKLKKKGRKSNVIAPSSIEDILNIHILLKTQKSIDTIVKSLNYTQDDLNKNISGFFGLLIAFSYQVKRLVTSSMFDHTIMFCVVFNTIILCLDGIVTSNDGIELLGSFNYAFTIIFAIDMGLKIIGLGLKGYLQDRMNIFDAAIVILSISEITFLSKSRSSFSAFRSIRILRVFRVFRVTRLLRSLQFMKLMMTAIASSIDQFIYILFLLLIVMFIYALLGMSLFGGQFYYGQNAASRMNFDNFFNAYFAVLEVITQENWNDILTMCLISSTLNFICITYLVSLLFIGNYVFMNLVLAIVMDSFDSEEVQSDKEEIMNRIEMAPDFLLSNSQNTSMLSNSLYQSMNFSYSQSMVQKSFLQKSSSGIIKPNKDQDTPKNNMVKEDDRSLVSSEDEQQDQLKNMGKKQKEFVFFEGVSCENSFYVFSKKNYFRRTIYQIYKSKHFESFIIGIILLSSIKLTIDTYISEDQEEQVRISNIIDSCFTYLFLAESLIKMISLGVFIDEGSYLRDSWSQLDFFIVITSIIDQSVSSIDLSFIKILRMLRTLRPLRLLSRNKSMRLIITALLQSIGGIVNMIMVVILIWIMFAILGMNLMRDKLSYCDFGDTSINYNIYYYHKQDCLNIPGAQWKTYNINSDNIGSSLMMLFILSTFEGWPNYVWNYIDGDESGPIKNNSYYIAIFFVVFIFIGGFFSINLFSAILSFNYDIAHKKSKNQYLTEEQVQWIELQRLIINSTPNFSSIKSPENKIRNFIWRVAESVYLETIVLFCIILNIVTMALAYDTASAEYLSIVSDVNLIFTAVFICEAIIKLIAYGFSGYFYKSWNRFDFFVVCCSIVDIVMTYLGKQVLNFLRAGPQLARVLRVLRVTRLLKLMKSSQGLQKLLQTAIFSIPSILNASTLLLLFYFMFSVLACYLFSSIDSGEVINNFNNFSTFHQSFLMLFRCSTGEDWMRVMFDTVNKIGGQCVIFFLTFIIIQQFIMMNLFILIVLNQFEMNYINPDNPLQNFNEQEELFKERWVIFTKQHNGVKIHEKQIPEFYFYLRAPLGYDYYQKRKDFIDNLKSHNNKLKEEEINSRADKLKIKLKQEADKKIMLMNIFCDSEGYIYFNELFYFIFKASLQESLQSHDSNEQFDEHGFEINFDSQKKKKGLQILKKEQQVTLKKLSSIKKRQQAMFKKQKNLKTDNKSMGVNPLVKRLFVSVCFRSWKKFSDQTQQKIKENSNYNKNDISSESDTSSYNEPEVYNEQNEQHVIPTLQYNENIFEREEVFRKQSNENNQNQKQNKFMFYPDENQYQDDCNYVNEEQPFYRGSIVQDDLLKQLYQSPNEKILNEPLPPQSSERFKEIWLGENRLDSTKNKESSVNIFFKKSGNNVSQLNEELNIHTRQSLFQTNNLLTETNN